MHLLTESGKKTNNHAKAKSQYTDLTFFVSPIEAVKIANGELSLIEEISLRSNEIKSSVDAMINERKIANKFDHEYDKAKAYHDKVVPYFEKIRYQVDKLELIVDNKMWPLPKYRELLFIR